MCNSQTSPVNRAYMFQVRTGILVPLTRNLVADSTISNIPIFEGDNVIGRSNLLQPDKRVSRKHITLQVSADSSTKIVVVCMLH